MTGRALTLTREVHAALVAARRVGAPLRHCAKSGRVARVIELAPRYCDVIRRRWTRYAREAGIDPGTGSLDP